MPDILYVPGSSSCVSECFHSLSLGCHAERSERAVRFPPPGCHAERSEASRNPTRQILRGVYTERSECAQHDNP